MSTEYRVCITDNIGAVAAVRYCLYTNTNIFLTAAYCSVQNSHTQSILSYQKYTQSYKSSKLQLFKKHTSEISCVENAKHIPLTLIFD